MLKGIVLTEKDVDYLEDRFKEVFITQEEFSQYKSELFHRLDLIHQTDHDKRLTALETS